MHRRHAGFNRRGQIGLGASAPRDNTSRAHRVGHRRYFRDGVRPHGRHADFKFRNARRHQRPGNRETINPVENNAGGLFTIAKSCIYEMEWAHDA